MGSDSPDNTESIASVIGQAVSALLKSGKEVGMQQILTVLDQEAARSVDGRKKLYDRAFRVVAGDTDG